MLEQPMNSRHAHVVQMFRAISHHPRGQQSFFRNGNIAGARGHHKDRALPGNFFAAFNGNDARQRMKLRGTPARSIQTPHGSEDLLIRASNQNILPSGLMPKHSAHDLSYLRGSFPFTKDHFRVPLPQRAVVIHLREAQILERQVLQPSDRAFRLQRAEAN